MTAARFMSICHRFDECSARGCLKQQQHFTIFGRILRNMEINLTAIKRQILMYNLVIAVIAETIYTNGGQGVGCCSKRHVIISSHFENDVCGSMLKSLTETQRDYVLGFFAIVFVIFLVNIFHLYRTSLQFFCVNSEVCLCFLH